MQHDRKLTAELLTESGMMPFVREVAARFGTNGKLEDIAVITKRGGAYVGQYPQRAKNRVVPLDTQYK